MKGNFTDRVGEKLLNNQGLEMTIKVYNSYTNIEIAFNDGTILKNVFYQQFKSKKVKNPNHPSVYGVGYMGQGEYVAWGGENVVKSYQMWIGMLQRCYDEKTQEKRPTYMGCTVSEEWHNYQNFAKWYEENYKLEYMQGWHLDKDIICPECRQYSPTTCAFVPMEVNSMFVNRKKLRGGLPIGVFRFKSRYKGGISRGCKSYGLGTFTTPEEAFQAYKMAKEKYIKEIAEKWKTLIDPRVYQAMMNYEVKITD